MVKESALTPLVIYPIEIPRAKMQITFRYFAEINQNSKHNANMSLNRMCLLLKAHCSLASSRGQPQLQ